MPHKLHIAREGIELGTLTLSEVEELLNAGFLLPTDYFWTGGMEDWKPFAEFEPPTAENRETAGFLKAAKGVAAVAGGVAASQAARLTHKMRAAAGDSKARLTESGRRTLELFTPQIRKLISRQLVEQSLTLMHVSLRDDEFMSKLFGATYDCLPKPVYRFVPEQAFVQFCMERRRELLEGPPEQSGSQHDQQPPIT